MDLEWRRPPGQEHLTRPSPADHTSASGQEELRAVARQRQAGKETSMKVSARAVGHLLISQLQQILRSLSRTQCIWATLEQLS